MTSVKSEATCSACLRRRFAFRKLRYLSTYSGWRAQPPLELEVQVAPFVTELARHASAHGLRPLQRRSSF